jgi:hypothetical protein
LRLKKTPFFYISRYLPSITGTNREKYGGAAVRVISNFSNTSETVEGRTHW